MDEIEYKLNTSNSVLVVNAIDKLISTIKSQFKPAERQRFLLENEELRLLREKCSSKEAVVSLTACQGLLALVELGVLEIAHTMSTIVTLLPSTHNYSAIISIMAGLLILDLKSRLVPGTPYKCQFSLRSPQHPFITVLERNKDSEDDVFAQMQAMCNHTDYIVSSNSLELLRPVFLYLTCNPKREGSIRPWRLLLSLPPTTQQCSLLIACLSSQRICTRSGIERAVSAYSCVADAAVYRRDEEYMAALLPLLARVSNELLTHGRDPRPCYALMGRGFDVGGAALRAPAALTLLLLAENLPRAPALYLQDTFNLCLNIITKYPVPSICVGAVVAHSLQWLHLPSYLTAGALTTAAKLLDIYREGTKTDTSLTVLNLKSNKIFNSLLHTDGHLSMTVKLLSVWERLRDDPNKLLDWLEGIRNTNNSLKVDLLSFFYGLLMERNGDFELVTLSVLEMIVDLVDFKKDVAVVLLPILVYKIANEKSPTVKLECLKALPLMAKTKENVPVIVTILNKLKSGKGVPTSFLITLYSALAETQVRCFPYLHELLVETGTGRLDDLKWEMDIAKISAVKRVCECRALSHGLQLVPIVSSTLNRCSDRPGTTAACIALQCIALLWRSGALAPHSAWRALQPKLERDNRLNVQINVCKLVGELAAGAGAGAECAGGVARAACALAWRLASEGAPALASAACRALANYPHTAYTLKEIPEIYRKCVRLPASHCKTPADAARKPEDVLDYIPCEVWPEVYKYTNQAALSGVVALCRSLVEREVWEYRGGVYHLQGPEPATLAHLPPHSVVRGLTDFFRKQATSPTYECPEVVTLAVLETLGAEYPRPLPPADAHYLLEVCARGGRWRHGAVTLAARWAKVCPSARLVLENWVHGLQNSDAEESDVLLFYTLLPSLTRCIPPNSLRPALERTLADSYAPITRVKAKIPYEKTLLKPQKTKKSKYSTIGETEVQGSSEDSEDHLFIRQLKLIEICLECENIHDANRTLLSQIVESYFSVISDDNVAWAAYVSCCAALPVGHVERITSPSGWWEVGAGAVRRAGAVRGHLARAPAPAPALAPRHAPLRWLNEIIDAQAAQITEQEYSLHYVYAALREASPHSEGTREWFLQLLARTQVAFNEMEDMSSKLYLCAVFALSVSALSGVSALEPDVASLLTARSALTLLPAGASALLRADDWAACTLQVLEWLCHTRDSLGGEVGLPCQRALLSLRHTDAFATHNIWTRLESYFGKDIIAE